MILKKYCRLQGEYLRELKSNFIVFLLPFHAYGASKYEKLNLVYKLGKQKKPGERKTSTDQK